MAVPLAGAKNKDKQPLPDYVLRAETVFVVIDPRAGEPLTDPSANRTAQEEVEKALSKWGRFRFAVDAQTADLVFVVRRGTGRTVTPTIRNLPTDNRPVILQPSENGGRIGGQQGRPPDLSQPGLGPQPDDSPRAQTEIGSSDDMLEVYRGRVEYPLDSSAVWRYIGKDALRAPSVPAVEQFHKAVDESEKIAAKKKQQKP
jgi:hypothetical protein